MDLVKKLKSLESFQRVSDSTVQNLVFCSQYHEFSKGHVLFEGGSHAEFVYLVVNGSFKLQEGQGQRDVVIYDFAGRGEFIGMFHSVLRVPLYPFSAIANEEAAVLRIPIRDFDELLSESADFSVLLHKQIAQRFNEIVHDRKVTRFLVAQKLADFLLRTLQRPSLARGVVITIPLTRVDVAKKIVSKEETVIRLLSAWTREGWIKTCHKHIEVTEPKALERIVADLGGAVTLDQAPVPSHQRSIFSGNRGISLT